MAVMTDFSRLVFEDILQINPNLLVKYPIVQDQVVYLLFIPHIILFLFLFGFVMALTHHRGLQYLLGVGSYVYIVYSGLYGKILVSIFLPFWQLLIFLGLFFFIGSRIVHPARVREIFELGKGVASKATEKRKQIKRLEDQIDLIEKKIRKLRRDRGASRDPHVQRILELEIRDLEQRRTELKHRIDKLGG